MANFFNVLLGGATVLILTQRQPISVTECGADLLCDLDAIKWRDLRRLASAIEDLIRRADLVDGEVSSRIGLVFDGSRLWAMPAVYIRSTLEISPSCEDRIRAIVPLLLEKILAPRADMVTGDLLGKEEDKYPLTEADRNAIADSARDLLEAPGSQRISHSVVISTVQGPIAEVSGHLRGPAPQRVGDGTAEVVLGRIDVVGYSDRSIKIKGGGGAVTQANYETTEDFESICDLLQSQDLTSITLTRFDDDRGRTKRTYRHAGTAAS